MRVEGKVVWITGAAGGIGRALALRFAAEGAKGLALVDLTQEGVDKVAAEIRVTQTLPVAADVRDEAALVATLRRTEEELGPIDLAISNAGIFFRGGAEVANEDWQRIWEINVLAHVFAARELVPKMIARGGGYLLHTASAAGLLSQIGSAPYAVTKHAAVSFAEWLAITHGAQGIKVSVLCPQAVRTAMTAGSERGGVAGVDGMLEAEAVAEAVVQGLDAEHFLILPHPEVAEYVRRKGTDRDRWIAGMQRLQEKVQAGDLP
jgi:NAD(P)-dependent dehydrogenase (short-subunit alcohol dehydrogenase family)